MEFLLKKPPTLWPKKWPAGSHLKRRGPHSSSILKTIATSKASIREQCKDDIGNEGKKEINGLKRKKKN